MLKITRKEMEKELLSSGIYRPEELRLLKDPIISDLYTRYMVLSGKLPIEEVNRPWAINYEPKTSNPLFNVDSSFYQNYLVASKDNKDGVAVYDFHNDRAIKHDELIQLTDAFADGLFDLGIQQGSKVGVIINGCYEEPMCLLSPNKNAARVKYLDYFKGPFAIKNDVDERGLDILLIDEMFLPMEPIINEKHLPVVVLNATKDYNGKYFTFDDILRRGASKSLNAVEMKSSEPALEINSSGTTGAPKPIVHSNFSVNSAAQKMMFSGFPLKPGNFTLKAIPSQIGLGSITTLYTSLVSGTGVILIRPETKEEAFKYTSEVLKKYKSIIKKNGLSEESLLMLFMSPMFVRSIHDDTGINDMSFIGGILAAGSKMGKKELEVMNKDFGEKGCTVPVNNAYGQNEKAGATTANTPKHDKPGSAGYPVIGTDVIIVDTKTGEEVPRDQTGRILESSDSHFLYYDGRDAETKSARVERNDGRVWFNTKDLGHMDSDGFVSITGRESRTITRSDFKIPLDTIEDKLRSLDIFKELAVVSRFSFDGTDEEPILFCVLKNDSLSLEDITPSIESVLGPYERPVLVEFLDKLPDLPSGKTDYDKLNQRAKQLPSTDDPKSLRLRFSAKQESNE